MKLEEGKCIEEGKGNNSFPGWTIAVLVICIIVIIAVIVVIILLIGKKRK